MNKFVGLASDGWDVPSTSSYLYDIDIYDAHVFGVARIQRVTLSI